MSPRRTKLLHELAAAVLLAVLAAGVGAALAWSLPYLPLCFGGSRYGGGASNPLREAARNHALEETPAAMKWRTLMGAAIAGGATFLILVAAVLRHAWRDPAGDDGSTR